ncbi:serine hydrolase [Legionella sp. PATHC035]|uniref:serine hydrolase n=1 Tax=Legionella sp. PATHC035 TaxID=2992040 RepID=UPI0022434268|nr:serine hydrolase [Legionella sp. PATHC035]MCW8408891.1 serine hydrolase [Legionella sp. PATHC035]
MLPISLSRVVMVTLGVIGTMVPTLGFSGSGRGDFETVYHGQSVDDLVIQFMKEHNIPGMSLAIVQAPYITRVVGYGLADTQTKRLAATNTVFHIGQLTNAYTAVAIMQLKEDGKLQLEQGLGTYLTDDYIPKKWSTITIRDLLTHSSGLPDYTEASDFDFSKEYTPAQIVALIKDKALLFTPGTQTSNSATDFFLLGLIIEKTSGMSYQEYVTKNQIERVGLHHTFFISNINTVKNEVNNGTNPFKHSQFLKDPVMINPTEPASGYSDENGANVPAKPLSWTATFSNSGLIASAEDISTWDIALAGTILVKDPKDREFLYHPVTLKNGKVIPGNSGWFFPGHPGMMEIKGNVPGYSAFLSRFTAPTELVCVTLLANKGDITDLDILGRKVAGAFDTKLAAPMGASWSDTIQSPYSVQETLDRVEALVKSQGGTVFARIDHSGEAAKAGQKLQATQVLIIGNPAKGTSIMNAKPAMALDLPLRIMATTDPDGQTWLSFTNPVALAHAYDLHDPQAMGILKHMEAALNKVCHKAVSSN